MTDSIDVSTIELSEEVLYISQELDDPKITEALQYVVKFIGKPEIPPAVAPVLINRLTALGNNFQFAAKWYKTYGNSGTGEAGKPARYKKDMYFTAAEAMFRMVDALKYTVRLHEIR